MTARMPRPKVNASARFANRTLRSESIKGSTIESKVMRITAVYLCEAENGLGFGEEHP
jgi:hypothetical protein